MIKMPYDQIIEKIKKESDLSEEKIQEKVKQKIDKLSGLISKEGAAHIIANELGIKLFEKTSGKLQIKNVLAGMRSVDVDGKVIRKYPINTFTRKTDGSKGKVASLFMADASGSIRVTLWGDQADQTEKLKEGDIVSIKNAYVRENRNKPEIHLATNSEFNINPKGLEIDNVKQNNRQRKEIQDLKEGDADIEILGTIVQVFDLRFYEVCPECNKRLKFNEGKFECDNHGEVEPKFAYVLNLFVDDSSENIRVVLFKNQVEHLVEKDYDVIITWKDDPSKFEDVKTELLGQIVKIIGRVTKNTMFDRIEFIAQLVLKDPDPEEELKNLDKKSSKGENKEEKSAVSVEEI